VRRDGPGDADGSKRAFRGLALVFLLSFLNLLGVILTATALGGVEPWSRWQFIGLFGVIEAASGLANVLSPNLWRLPIAQLQSGPTEVKLAASTIMIPHWGALARTAAGLVLISLAAWQVGLSPASLALVPFVLALAWSILAFSAVVARVGVARAELDVFQLVVIWRGRKRELAPVSIGASVMQFLLSIVTIPIAKLLPSSVLYQPELAPSVATTAFALSLAGVLLLIVWLAWSGRIEMRAPRRQQREAERHA
jgi:hypothetical protein